MKLWTAARVKRLRKRLGLSQREFAARLSYSANSKATVSYWETGARAVTRRAYPALDLLDGECPARCRADQ